MKYLIGACLCYSLLWTSCEVIELMQVEDLIMCLSKHNISHSSNICDDKLHSNTLEQLLMLEFRPRIGNKKLIALLDTLDTEEL